MKWTEEYKLAARIKAATAVRHGIIKREPCCKCGNDKAEQHHEDYDKPLDIIWLCRKCHTARHKELKWPRKISYNSPKLTGETIFFK